MGSAGATWQAHGYSGAGNVAELIDSAKGRAAVVCGSAVTVFMDMSKAMQTLEDPLIFAVNDVGMFLPQVDHWVSLHAKNLLAWKQVRWLHPHAVASTQYHSIDALDGIDYCWQGLAPLLVLSGYFAAQIAYLMGCNPIVLAGCPGNATRRFFEAESHYGYGVRENESSIQHQLMAEMHRVPEFRYAVYSMSGWTREFFGGLTQLNGRRK
jgi:hypothetical protein